MQGRLSRKDNLPLQSFPYFSWQNEFKIAKNIGFKSIEWLIDKENDFRNPIFSKEGRDLINNLKNENEISIETLCAHFMIDGGFLKNQLIRNYFRKIINLAPLIGVKYVSIPLMDNISLRKSEIKNEIERFLLEIINELKVSILLETDIPNLETFSFINKINSDKIGIIYDTGNATKNNFSFRYDFPKIAPRVKEIHLKDFSRIKNKSVTLGNGDTNFLEVFAILNKCKWNGILMLETPIFDDFEKEAINNFNYILNHCVK